MKDIKLLDTLEENKIIELGRGKVISKIEMNNNKGCFPVYSSAATGNGKFGEYGKYMFDDERITWSIDGGGKFFYREKHKYSVTNVCGWIKINNPAMLNTKYAYYNLLNQWKYLSFDYVSKAPPSKIKKVYSINIINLDKQKKIVNVLDRIQQKIDINNDILSNINELIKSQFNELFSDCTHYEKLADLSLSKGQYGAGSASIEYNPNRPRYVRITDINDDGSLNNDFVSSENLQDDSDYKLEYGDFLFARIGATVGKTYCYEKGDEIFAGYLIRFRLNTNKIIPKYMYWYTKTEQYLNWVRLNQSGAAQPGINEKKYSNLIVLVPPINKQKIFIEFVKQCDKF